MSETQNNSPKLYLRGNENVDLDLYLSDVDSKFEFWLANSRLKEDKKREARNVYEKIKLGIINNLVSYSDTSTGGFNISPTLGIDPNSLIALLVAGQFGEILRGLSTYVAPEPAPDPSKILFKGNDTIRDIVSYLLFGDSGDPNYFIQLDTPVNGKRALTNRIALIRDIVDYINDRWKDGSFIGYTPLLKSEWDNNYTKYRPFLNSDSISESLYYGLSRLLGGFTGIEKILATNYTDNSKLNPAPEISLEDAIKYILALYPVTKNELKTALFGNFPNYTWATRNQIRQNLYDLDDNDMLFDVINVLLDPDDNINTYQEIKNGLAIDIDPDYIFKETLEILRERNKLYLFDENSNLFYIPIEDYSDSVGLVYNIGDSSVNEMNKIDIPYFIKLGLEQYLKSIQYNKKGGVLKFSEGGSTDWNLVAKYRFNDPDLASRHYWNSTLKLFGSLYTKPTKSKLDPQMYSPNGDVSDLENLQYYKDFILDLTTNEELAKQFAADYIKHQENAGNTEVADYWKNNWYDNGVFKIDAFRTKTGKNGKLLWADLLGGHGHDMYFKSVYYDKDSGMYYAEKPKGYKTDGDWEFQNDKHIYVRNLIKDPAAVVPEKQGDGSELTPNNDLLIEDFLHPVEESLEKESVWSKAVPFAGEVGRMMGNIIANNKNKNILRPSILPTLRTSPERNSPVTGKFGYMQYAGLQGSLLESMALKPLTSDANLTSRVMLDAYMLAWKIRNEGFLTDDLEIMRTKAEALNRQEDSMMKRTENANVNRESINKARRERAALEAATLKANWQSVDNFISGNLARLRLKLDEKEVMSTKFREQIALDRANRWYTSVMKDADDMMNKYIRENTKDGVAPDITSTQTYKEYIKRQRLAEDMRIAMLRKDAAAIYGLSYRSPYTDEAYNKFAKWNIKTWT